MMVGMTDAFRPEGTLEGGGRQRRKIFSFLCEEGGTLPLLCGSVDLHPDLFLTPMKGPLVGVADVGS